MISANKKLTNRELSILSDPLDVEDALFAALRASRHLCRPWPNPQKALEIIRAYADCVEYTVPERVKPEKREKLLGVVRCMVYATTADCYRMLGEIRTAAEWYRQAGEICKGCGFPPIYADMVLETVWKEVIRPFFCVAVGSRTVGASAPA